VHRMWTERLTTPIVVAALVALYGPTAAWLWERWTMSVWHNAHGLLIPPVVAYFIYLELKPLRHHPPSSSAWGFLVLVPALLLHVLDTGMHTQLLSAVSLVLALPGLSLLFLGVPRTKAILFPLAFAAFALPIPLAMTESIHLALRHIATDATAWIVPMLGVPVYAEGTTLQLAAGNLIVSDACSGFSTLYASAAMACLTAHQGLTWPRRAIVLASAAPLAITANIVRIVLLVMFTDIQGIEVLATWIHPASGMLTFALALPAIFWLGRPPATDLPSPRIAVATDADVEPTVSAPGR
jgi:exosortase